MVDDLTPQDPTALLDGGAPIDPADAKQGFMSTTLGKVVVIGGAAVVLLSILGVVAFFLLSTFVFNATEDVLTDVGQGIESQITTGTVDSDAVVAAEPTEPGDVPLSSVFTFRDIFDPLIKAPEATETAGVLDPDFTPEPDTLYLVDIVVENGVSSAVLVYNDATYTLPEGGVVGSTPWMVLSIGSGSVTMLYGDSQITLVVGQGVSSK